MATSADPNQTVPLLVLVFIVHDCTLTAPLSADLRHGDDFSGQFFRIFEIIILCFVVAIFDLVHAVEATYGLP